MNSLLLTLFLRQSSLTFYLFSSDAPGCGFSPTWGTPLSSPIPPYHHFHSSLHRLGCSTAPTAASTLLVMCYGTFFLGLMLSRAYPCGLTPSFWTPHSTRAHQGSPFSPPTAHLPVILVAFWNPLLPVTQLLSMWTPPPPPPHPPQLSKGSKYSECSSLSSTRLSQNTMSSSFRLKLALPNPRKIGSRTPSIGEAHLKLMEAEGSSSLA